MDVHVGDYTDLSTLYNVILVPCVVLSVLFILLVAVHTPRDMLIYKYTMLNISIWSLLIILHLTLVFRPVTFLPLPICAVTGLAKYFGRVVSSSQLLVGLFLIANKSVSLFLCVASNYFSLVFPLYVRQLTFRRAAVIFTLFHIIISVLMSVTAWWSYGDRTILNEKQIIGRLRHMYPTRFDDVLELANNSVVIGVRNNKLSSFATGLFLFLSCLTIVLSFGMMWSAGAIIDNSIAKRASKTYIRSKRRLKKMIIIRTLLPILTYSLPITISVAVVHYNVIKFAGAIQWLLLTSILSPLVGSTMTIFSISAYRHTLLNVITCRLGEVFARKSTDSDLRKMSSAWPWSPRPSRAMLTVVP